MKFRSIFTCIIALCASMMCMAQSSAADVLAKTSAKINSGKLFTADFVARSGDGASVSGKMAISREKFLMEAPDFGVWYNGEDMWSYYQSTGEASLTCPTADELLECNPFVILSQYASRYKASLISHSAGTYRIKFTPLSKNAGVKSAEIAIDGKTWLPKYIDAYFANNTAIKIDISNIQESPKAPTPAYFDFPASKYPGIEVVDLR